MPLRKSVYDEAEHLRDRVMYKGFNYEGRIFEKSMSNYLFREEKRRNILAMLETVVFELIERVKQIKNHVNYVVGKNYRDKN